MKLSTLIDQFAYCLFAFVFLCAFYVHWLFPQACRDHHILQYRISTKEVINFFSFLENEHVEFQRTTSSYLRKYFLVIIKSFSLLVENERKEVKKVSMYYFLSFVCDKI